MTDAVTHEEFSRADAAHTADTWGKWPGIAAVYLEHYADVFCQTCARDMLGDKLFERCKGENPGYDHDRTDEFGNIAVVLSNEEWDCPGAHCGHCCVPLDVRVIHYDDVCQPDTCPKLSSPDE
jgi:hypothetical protein